MVKVQTVQILTGYYRKQPVVRTVIAVEHTVPGLFNGQPALFVQHPKRVNDWWMVSREGEHGYRSLNVAPEQKYQDELTAMLREYVAQVKV